MADIGRLLTILLDVTISLISTADYYFAFKVLNRAAILIYRTVLVIALFVFSFRVDITLSELFLRSYSAVY